MPHRLSDGPGDGLQFLRPVLRGLVHIDANAGDNVLKGGSLSLNGHLRQNTADLAAVHDDVVGPLDLRTNPGSFFNAVADGDSHVGSQIHRLGRGEVGPEQDRIVDTLAFRGGKAPPQPAPAPGLLIRHGGGAVGQIARLPLQIVVGGVNCGKDFQVPGHVADAQIGQDLTLCQPIRGREQLIAPVGDGVNFIPLLPETLHCLGDGCPADAQLAAHLGPGEVALGLIQKGEDLLLAHGICLHRLMLMFNEMLYYRYCTTERAGRKGIFRDGQKFAPVSAASPPSTAFFRHTAYNHLIPALWVRGDFIFD